MRASSPEAEEALRALEARRHAAGEEALRVADEMIAGVRAHGDAYVAEQIERFDRVRVRPVLTAPRPVEIEPRLAAALELAISRVEQFHAAQLPRSYRHGEVTHRVQPLARAGVYVPGGRAVYVSTLIMCAVPARLAGVPEIVVATPPAAAATDALQWVCNRLGIREIYRCGGAAGIAALALGTESLRRVDKIAGPGNAYVTAAKARLVGEVGIDMTAGPTELVVIADSTADAALVQADLDAQQEHGPDSAVICISVGQPLAVRATLSLVAGSVAEAVAVADRIAPEHLSIHADAPERIAAMVRNAGAIYCGPASPPAAGDYTVGSNHVLPTAGSARFFSPLGVDDFVKRTNVVSLSEETLASIASAAALIARFEGLPAHAQSIERRMPPAATAASSPSAPARSVAPDSRTARSIAAEAREGVAAASVAPEARKRVAAGERAAPPPDSCAAASLAPEVREKVAGGGRAAPPPDCRAAASVAPEARERVAGGERAAPPPDSPAVSDTAPAGAEEHPARTRPARRTP